jgi:hypothetical protein
LIKSALLTTTSDDDLTVALSPSANNVERDRQRGRRAERVAPDMRVVVGDQRNIGQPVKEALDGDPGFQTRQMQSQARVFARRKRYVRDRLADGPLGRRADGNDVAIIGVCLRPTYR